MTGPERQHAPELLREVEAIIVRSGPIYSTDGAAAEVVDAVRAFDLARQPYATRDADGTVTIVWPQGRADALWVSADLLEQLMRELADPDQDAAERAAPPPRPAPTGVPRCNGRVWLDTEGRFRDPCTLPLGHHGGCR